MSSGLGDAAEDAPTHLGLRRWWSRLEIWAVVVVLVPIAAAVARHSTGSWLPIGDDALIELRARDVFSWRHMPLLGTWSSASLSAGKDLNHPGPLLFDLLAVPVRLFGGRTGMAVGVGVINGAAVVGIMVAARRIAGATAAVWATVVTAALAWTMGSVMLTDAWNPHVVMLPCLLMLVLAWGVGAGDVVLFPWLLGVGSLCLQTHLGYAYLVPSACLGALLGAGLVVRRRWRADPGTTAGDRARLGRMGLISVVAMLVLWLQPIIEQFTGAGQGNIARIITSAGSDEPTVGASMGVRILARVVALPPWWSRPSFTESVPITFYEADGVTVTPRGLPGTAVAVLGLLAVLVVALLVARAAWRRRDRVGTAAVAVALGAIFVGLASLTIMPIGPLGLTPHQMRWLWSIAAFAVMALVINIVRATSHRLSAPVGFALVVLAALSNLPAHRQAAGPESAPRSMAPALALSDQASAWIADGPVWLDTSGLRFLEPYSAVVMSALIRGGVDLRVEEPFLVRQLGDARARSGGETQRLYLREAREALVEPVDAIRVAFTSPLTAAEIAELIAGEVDMADEIAMMGIVFSAEGERLVDSGAFGATRDQIVAASFAAESFVGSGMAAQLIAAGALELDPRSSASLSYIAELRLRVGDTTVAVFAEPL